ncbi:MAG: hypothetical protein AAGA70_03570 [Pseudomonadota bacterium]
MSDMLPKAVREGLAAPNRNKFRHRLTIHAGGKVYPILRLFDRGFEVDDGTANHLRGLVDIYDGQRHMTHALIVATGEEDGVRRYEYKRQTPATATPPRDFVEP